MNKNCDLWHMTCDRHVTHDMLHKKCDMWNVTRETSHVTCCGGWTFSQISALTVCDTTYKEMDIATTRLTWPRGLSPELNQYFFLYERIQIWILLTKDIFYKYQYEYYLGHLVSIIWKKILIVKNIHKYIWILEYIWIYEEEKSIPRLLLLTSLMIV